SVKFCEELLLDLEIFNDRFDHKRRVLHCVIAIGRELEILKTGVDGFFAHTLTFNQTSGGLLELFACGIENAFLDVHQVSVKTTHRCDEGYFATHRSAADNRDCGFFHMAFPSFAINSSSIILRTDS